MPTPSTPSEAGFTIFAQFGATSAQLLRVAPASRVPRRALSALVESRAGTALTLLDGQGSIVEAFGFESEASHYGDWFASRQKRPAGRTLRLPPAHPDVRVLRVPAPPEQGAFLFHRLESPGPGQRTRHVPLALYPLDRDLPSLTAVRPWGMDLSTLRARQLPWVRSSQPRISARPKRVLGPVAAGPESEPAPFPGLPDDFSTPDGHIVDWKMLADHGDPSTHFDVVIMGDGFQEGELQTFDKLAAKLVRGLRKIPPFRDVDDLINWHVVRVASKDSGVEHCPARSPRDTYFQTEGCWENTPPSARAFVGTEIDGLRRIWFAAGHAVPIDFIDLIILIVNCRHYGGHAHPDGRVAFVSACWDDPTWFVPMVAHECGHMIGGLADEYISEGPDGPPAPNKAPLAAVMASVEARLREKVPSVGKTLSAQSDSVWWRVLAKDGEFDGQRFEAVHVVGDRRRSLYRPRLSPRRLERQLGVFWGCGDTRELADLAAAYTSLLDLTAPLLDSDQQRLRVALGLPDTIDPAAADNHYWNPKGALFFRPGAVCRMRHVTFPFCYVCERVIADRIRDACGT